jgi:hypothetical protein
MWLEPHIRTTALALWLAVPQAARGDEPRAVPQATPATSLTVPSDGGAPTGYVLLPSARSALRLSGYLKLDVIHDTGPYSGDAAELPNFPLQNDPGADPRRGVTRLHARESRLALGTITETPGGWVLTYLETDFFAGGGATTYAMRMRHAYVSWQYLLAGQTWSNFLDVDAKGKTVESNGATGGGTARRPQVRLTFPLTERLRLALAFENGATDYTDPKGNRILGSDALDAFSSGSVQQLPELTFQLRYTGPLGHLSLRGLGRRLAVLRTAASPLHGAQTGYGLGASGKLQPWGKSSVFAQVSGGRGVGGYITDLEGQSATFDVTGSHFASQFGYGAVAGFEIYFSDRWRSNVIASVSGVALAAAAPMGPGIKPLSTRFLEGFWNILYDPVRELSVGLEYVYLRRETNQAFWGQSHRLQIGITYRIGG